MMKIWWLFYFHFFLAKYIKGRLRPISQARTQTSASHIWLLSNVPPSALIFLDFWFTSSISSSVTLATSELGNCISSSPLAIKKDDNKWRLLFILFPQNCFPILPSLRDWYALLYLDLTPQFFPLSYKILFVDWALYNDIHTDLASLREMPAGFQITNHTDQSIRQIGFMWLNSLLCCLHIQI